MHEWSRTRWLATGAVAVTLLLSGCADDSNSGRADIAERESGTAGQSTSETTDATASESTVPQTDEETVAFGLCSALRDQTNVMTEIANTTARDINEQTPDERYAALYDGYDRGRAASIAFHDSLDDLDLPAIAELDALVVEIAVGAEAAAAEFADEQARFVGDVDGSVSDDDAQGRVSELFNSIEKANSLVEPVIFRYERVELKRAFLDEPECRYVIQQFVLDES